MPPNQNEKNLKACLRDPKKTKTQCYQEFQTATGATIDGGKVFVAPNGDVTAVTTGGSVVSGGKVF